MFLRCLPFKSCRGVGGIYCLLLTRIFCKNAQKPHKNAVKTDCIYFDRFFWLPLLGSNQRHHD